jgi:hypothetical protein
MGDERALTGAAGRAALTTEFRRPGPHAVRAAKGGCRSTRAWVRTVR